MEQIPKRCDVIVIGGGPAGSMASALLAQRNIDVVLFEKEIFPRTVVGESLIPHFWKYMDLIGVADRIEQQGFIVKGGAAALWDHRFRKMSFNDFGYNRPALHVEREEFDQILLNRAGELGVNIQFKHKVLKVQHDEEWTSVTFLNEETKEEGLIEARYIIDATGQKALVARQEKIRIYDEGFRFHAFWGYYKGGNYLDGSTNVRSFGEQIIHPPLTFISSIGDWGWSWQILLKQKTSIGLIVPKERIEEFKKGGKSLDERFHSMLSQVPITGNLMHGARLIPNSVKSIKDYAYKPVKLTVGNCFLVGDAAAFVDPVNSAGVVMALYGAFLASRSIIKSLDAPEDKKEMIKFFEKQIKLRLDLFRLLAFPQHLVSEKMINNGRKILSQLDDREKQLALTTITLTNRSKNLPQLIEKIPHKDFITEVELSHIESQL
jgi:flavin-dependent dehydrogenase